MARQAIGINPHYSTATAILAENAIRWDEWENAIWLMKATMSTRPNEVALLVGVSRAYLTVGKPEEAQVWFNRAARVQPSAPYVRVQKAYLLLAQRDYQLAADIIAERLDARGADHDLVNAAYILGEGTRDWRLAIRALEQQIKNSPKDAANAWLDLGELYSRPEIANEARAVESYRNALSLTPGYLRNRVWQRIPPSVQRLMQP
jgi:tetratricopeptide (TPR) repeat protein